MRVVVGQYQRVKVVGILAKKSGREFQEVKLFMCILLCNVLIVLCGINSQ